jgi:hypothetical protein
MSSIARAYECAFFFAAPECLVDEALATAVEVGPVPAAVTVVELGGFTLAEAAVAVGEVNAGGSVPTGLESHGCAPGIFGAARPAYVATNFATSIASCPTTTFWGMYAPENPPLMIAYMTRSIGRSQRTLKSGPLIAVAVRGLAAEPWVAA